MNGPWTVLFYEDARGREPVREWLDDLATRRPGEYGAVRHAIDLLEEFGVLLEEPHTRRLSGKLRELRAGPWRVTYFADPQRRMVLLTSFRKTGRRTEPAEIRRALRLVDDWLEVGAMAATRRACPEPLGSFESRFFKLLEGRPVFRVDGETLTLVAGNQNARLRRAGASDGQVAR